MFQATWRDGSIDLFAGLAVAAIGVAWVLDLIWLGACLPPLFVPVWVAFRRQVTESRFGYVRFAPERRGRLNRAQIGLILVGVAVLVGFITAACAADGAPPPWLVAAVPALPAVLVGIGALVSAIAFGIPRLAAFAPIFAATGGAVAWWGGDPGWSLLAGGAAVAAWGGWMLARFLRAFPVLSNELE